MEVYECDGANNLISSLISQFKKNNPGHANEINSPKTYGSMEKPLFKVKEIEKSLDKKNIGKVIFDDKKKNINERIYKEGRDYIYAFSIAGDGSKRRQLFFTNHGFRRYIMTSRGAISNIIRSFIIDVLDEIEKYDKSILKNVFNKNEEKYRLELSNMRKELSDSIMSLESEKNKRKEAESIISEVKVQRDDYKYLLSRNEKKLKLSYEYNENMINDFPEDKNRELEIMKKKFFKPVQIYLEDPEYIKRKLKNKNPKLNNDIDSDSSDSENEEENFINDMTLEYDYDEYDKPYDNEIVYISLSYSKKINQKKIHLKQVLIENKEQYMILIKYLKKNCYDGISDIYTVCVNEIEEKITEIFIRENRQNRK